MTKFKTALHIAAAAAIGTGTVLAAAHTPATPPLAWNATHPATRVAMAPMSAQAIGDPQEDDPSFDCHKHGNRVCGTPALRRAVQRLGSQPAMLLPGQWVRPDGTTLVNECFASYPGVNGNATPELWACLSDPDPRKSDKRVITVHQNHVNHVNHIARTAR